MIEIYLTQWCPYCRRARALLDSKQVDYSVIDLDVENDARDTMIKRAGQHTVPQIFINQQHIGGCDDLYALEHQGKLDPLLHPTPN